IRPHQVDVLGAEWHDSEMPKVLATLRREMRWDTKPAPGRGRGIALGARHVGRGTTSMELTAADGLVVVRTGVTDQGGGAHTMIQRVVAHELGISPDRKSTRLNSSH